MAVRSGAAPSPLSQWLCPNRHAAARFVRIGDGAGVCAAAAVRRINPARRSTPDRNPMNDRISNARRRSLS
jgi:hypothetical protein